MRLYFEPTGWQKTLTLVLRFPRYPHQFRQPTGTRSAPLTWRIVPLAASKSLPDMRLAVFRLPKLGIETSSLMTLAVPTTSRQPLRCILATVGLRFSQR